MITQVVILAAGLGTRLGKPWPKALTPLIDGRSILYHQIENIRATFKSNERIFIVVGFKFEMIMEAHPDVAYIYNETFDQTNTSKSLLKALKNTHDTGVLWLNGDVVFDPRVLERVKGLIEIEQSFVCVNTANVGEEEVKYTVDNKGNIKQLSKKVENALGEAVGINFISKRDKSALIHHLTTCQADDYFERGIELAIEHAKVEIRPVDISDFFAIEIDFPGDLERANLNVK